MYNRVQCISCSKACRCSKKCANRPFQKVKKIQIVKVNLVDFVLNLVLPFGFSPSNINNTVCGAYQTELCGWGVVAAESISKGDFIVEYVGEGKFLQNQIKMFHLLSLLHIYGLPLDFPLFVSFTTICIIVHAFASKFILCFLLSWINTYFENNVTNFPQE